ncbi:MAG: NAD-dependent epimerase/dehydratase family protein [Chloroflexi bacterium]|nr:NAD-dependent epimerase/dehydratase family protein [Chloroflexota bacterium]
MRALVTGGAGFIGQRLLRRLAERGVACRALVRPGRDTSALDGLGIEWAAGDVTDPATLRGLAADVDVVYHLAAVGHVAAQTEEDYQRFRRVNVEGTRNLLRACQGERIARFVHFSSTAAMGTLRRERIDETAPCQPATPYQKSKREGELAALAAWRESGVPALALRPCMVYGPGGEGEFLKFCRLFARGLFPRVGRSPNLTPLVHVDDVVQAALLAGERGRPGEVYLVAGERSYPLAELRAEILAALGLRRPYVYMPLWLALAGAWALETTGRVAGRVPPVTRRNILSTTASRVFDIGKARAELGYRPAVTLAQGVRETVAWYRERGLV